MKKRIFIGGLHHESDTFNPIITGKKDIRVKRGQALLDMKTSGACSGIIAELKANNVEIIPSILAGAVPNGEWDKNCYLDLRNELLNTLKSAGKLDGICLALHGSMRVCEIGEAEGDLLREIRKIQPSIPIVASLDMHATFTKAMLEYCDAYVGYKCAPHTDEFETGQQAARMLLECLNTGNKPQMSVVKMPFLVAGEQSETSVEPMKSYTQHLREIEKTTEQVMAASILMGFPWADNADSGASILVVTKTDKQLADKIALDLANEFWNRRREFHFYNETSYPEATIEAAKSSVKAGVFPVVISDSGDNPTAGSSGDQVAFLDMLIKDEAMASLKPVYEAIYDKEVVDLAFKIGEGKQIITSLGAKYDKGKCQPIQIQATVVKLVKNWKSESNLALLNISGVQTIVVDAHVGCYDPDMMRVVDICPEKQNVIIVKLGYLEPEIRKISKRGIMALTKGSSDELFERFNYTKLKRPMYPLDKEFSVKLKLFK